MIFIILKDPLVQIINEDDEVVPGAYLLFCTSCMHVSIVKNIQEGTVMGCSCTNCNALTIATDNPRLFVVDNPNIDDLQTLADHKEVESIPGKDTMMLLSRIKYLDEVLKFATKVESNWAVKSMEWI